MRTRNRAFIRHSSTALRRTGTFPGLRHRPSRPRMRARTLVPFLAVSLAHGAAAQSTPAAPPAIPWFDLGESSLELRGDARPNVYLASAGRRAIAMGTEDGRLEL